MAVAALVIISVKTPSARLPSVVKNWLFCDSQDGAYATMTMYTIFAMAKIYNLNQYEYMKYLLEQRPSADMTDEELSKLAPWSETVQNVCGITK